MFDIGWSEMAIIMLLALIIIGPKDLPRVARTIGQWVRKGRMLAREFQTSLEDMAKEADLDDVKKEIEKVGKTDLKKAVENHIDPKGELTKAFDTSSPVSGKASGEGDKDSGGNDTPAKALNGSGTDKTDAASPTSTSEPAKAETPASAAAKRKVSTAAKPSKPKSTASAKKPASTAKKPAATPAATKAKTAKKPAAPRKRAAKPASSPQSGTNSPSDAGDKPSSSDDGGATMAAKSS